MMDEPDDTTPTARQVLAEASTWLGTPYRHGSSHKGLGCDCLGLVRGIWRALYGAEPEMLPTYAADWAEAGGGEPLIEAACRHMRQKPVAEAAPGDLLVFRWRAGLAAKHLGVLAADGRFIHAYERHCVMASVLVPQWRRRIAGAFAFPNPTDARPVEAI
jgi:NlpC/P60 family putative phage cell wall peptidase